MQNTKPVPRISTVFQPTESELRKIDRHFSRPAAAVIPPRNLTIAQAAAYLGLSGWTVRDYI